MIVVQQRTEYKDGTVLIDERPIPLKSPESDVATIQRKLTSARRYGWQYDLISDSSLHTWKTYEEGPVVRKDRYFRSVTVE